MVNVGTGTSGTRFINTNYPYEEGLDAATSKLRLKAHLEAEKDLVDENDKVGC